MRVSVESTALLSRPTGVGVFCRELLEALNDRSDVEASAFAISWRRRDGLGQALPGFDVRQRPMPARPLHWLWGRVEFPPVDWFVPPTDVLHGTNFVVPPTRACAVVTVHDLTVLRFPELCDAATLAFPDLIRRAIRRGAVVHTPSQYIANEVLEHFDIEAERVRAVASGLPPLAPPAPRPFTLPSGTTRYLLSASTAEPRKDLPGLVRAFDGVADELPDVALVLAGPPGWGSADLDAAIAACAHRQRIVQPGWVDDATLSGLLHEAAALVYPSRYEGFGFPPLQAMSIGTPVLTTAAGAVPEVVGNGALIVPVGDHDALSAALITIVTDENLRRDLAQRGLERASQFSWKACADGLVGLYERALST